MLPTCSANHTRCVIALALAVGFYCFIKSRGDTGNSFGRVAVCMHSQPWNIYYLQANQVSAYLVNVKIPGAESSFLPYVLLANIPQLIASLIYFVYNGLWTTMLANREWTGYSTKRAPLRVTLPRIGQRSTHYLQLPFTWSVPLLIAGIALHWFISQSIFVARVALYQDGILSRFHDASAGQGFKALASSGNVYYGLGYWDTAILAVIVWGAAMILSSILVAYIFTYPQGVGIGGTNSAVLSAACHARHSDGQDENSEEDMTTKPLQWGVTIPGDVSDRVGHCSFSSGEVGSPVVGSLYAGATRKVD
jgi:hypothetical protein